MLLAIDIGNTSVTCGLFEASRLVKHWRLSTAACRSASALARGLRRAAGSRRRIDGIGIVSVVPRLDRLFRTACRSAFQQDPLFATWRTIPMRIRSYDRRQLGADRLVAAWAAWERYRRPVIVIDAGTAITIDLVNGRGEFAGGVIVPGLASAAASLHAMTAKLPLVLPRPTGRSLGRTTREAINSGIVHGYAGLIEHLVRSISRQARVRPAVIATGGDAALLARMCSAIDAVDPHLILEGLQRQAG